ncbi:hypothetical protein FNV43_RR19619 [Rhamnella rubrinervis]|uniref:Uncharacterized protein n=1 Tax=Rhamnella rubrinervis TaxID=2594499 RepID=A0A8K0DUF2_9ROSA|nr:hypothetical protein FNV43_RR19619 [Rhamnella rubrinervis]
MSNLIESKSSFRRSRSVAIPFLKLRSRFVSDKDVEHNDGSEPQKSGGCEKNAAFWSVLQSYGGENSCCRGARLMLESAALVLLLRVVGEIWTIKRENQ